MLQQSTQIHLPYAKCLNFTHPLMRLSPIFLNKQNLHASHIPIPCETFFMRHQLSSIDGCNQEQQHCTTVGIGDEQTGRSVSYHILSYPLINLSNLSNGTITYRTVRSYYVLPVTMIEVDRTQNSGYSIYYIYLVYICHTHLNRSQSSVGIKELE